MRAELVAPDEINDQLAFAELAIDALFATALFEPLPVHVELACCDAETGVPLHDPKPVMPFHQLRRSSVPEAVAIPEVWTETRVAQNERLDRAGILDWLGTILAGQRCPAGWTQLLVEAVRARLPEGIAAGDELPVGYGAGVIRYPVERSADASRVAGPLATNYDTAPFNARIVNEGGALSLDLTVNWSLWIDGAGRPGVDAAVDRLKALGWDVSVS